MFARLPAISIGDERCRLPLAEPTAAALLTALLDPMTDSALAALGESLALDPALALWAAFHQAAHSQDDACGAGASPAACAASVGELSQWLCGQLPLLLRDAEASDTLPALPRPAALATRAASDVAAALAVGGEQSPFTDRLYLSALLPAGWNFWTKIGGCSAAAAESLPGWLADVCRNHAQGESLRTPTSAARRTKSGRKSANDAGNRKSPTTKVAKQFAESAKQRWLVTPGFASKNFVPIAQRLSALSNLQATFDERLEAEKLEALAEFAAGAGHEINNPLAVISGRAQLFLRHEQDPERRRELAVINTQARRVHEMIADLMLFARPPEPQLADCDVTELIDAVTTELGPDAKQGGVEISVTLAEDLGTISADTTQLQVALRAVCQNALEALAGRDDGRIEIAAHTVEIPFIESAPQLNAPPFHGGARGGSNRPSADDAPTHVQIAVRDNGPGMPPEVRRHAFDPFYSGRGAGRGLGNGLSKCWRIVTAHGGRVEIDTKPCGTSVTMLLPLSRPHSVQE